MVKRTTIGDVASHAGVSTATVSRVLNGGTVAEATATRVRAAVTQLQYSPNALTRSIFAGHAHTIGVIIRDLSSPFYLDLIRGIDEIAAADGNLVILANSDGRTDREVAQVRSMDEQRVRGLIVTTDPDTDEHTRRMAERGTPCVIIARTVPEPPAELHTISLDNTAAGAMMAEHLAACGRSAIGVIAGSRPSQVERTDGLRRALDALALPEPAVATTEYDTVDDAVQTLLAHARRHNRPLDAIACLTGRLTVAVHTTLAAQGIAIGTDVAFLTMDDFPWAATLGITVITQPARHMGRQAAELILDPPTTPAALIHKPTLIARNSCGERNTGH
jgi:LacI family transcriptional regulator